MVNANHMAKVLGFSYNTERLNSVRNGGCMAVYWMKNEIQANRQQLKGIPDHIIDRARGRAGSCASSMWLEKEITPLLMTSRCLKH